jgi:hypothetical protein
MEGVWGPIDGFYIAAYAGPSASGKRYCAYAKVCWSQPDSYWESDCVFKLFGGEEHDSELDALHSAALEAYSAVADLPPRARELAEYHRTSHVEIPRIFVHSWMRPRVPAFL